MSNDDIARASGLARGTIAKLSKLDKWDTVTFATADAFAHGCGIDILAPSKRRDKRLIKEGGSAFFRNSSPAQRRMFGRMLRDFRGGHNVVEGGAPQSDEVTGFSARVASM